MAMTITIWKSEIRILPPSLHASMNWRPVGGFDGSKNYDEFESEFSRN